MRSIPCYYWWSHLLNMLAWPCVHAYHDTEVANLYTVNWTSKWRDSHLSLHGTLPSDASRTAMTLCSSSTWPSSASSAAFCSCIALL